MHHDHPTAFPRLPTATDRRPGVSDERAPAAARLPIIKSQRRAARGFTLIEMMCTITVAGLLGSVAYPAYTGTVTKTRRADALAATMALQAAQERYRSGSTRYGSLADIGMAPASPGGHYVLSVPEAHASGYTLLAVATGSQAGDGGCRYMKVTADGADLRYSSGTSEAAANDAAANRRCWNL